MFDIRWALFKTEIGLVALTLTTLVLDIFLRDDDRRGKKLGSFGMIGVALLFFQHLFGWRETGSALNGSVSQDGLAFFFRTLFLIAAFLAIFMAREYQPKLKRGHGEFVLLILFSLVGMLFLTLASDFLVFFISLEILTVSLYVMTAYLKDENRSIEAGAKYLVLGALSTAVFLYGLSFVYGAAGSTSYGEIQAKLAGSEPPAFFLFGVILIVSSLCFKIAAVPFQFWAPDVYEGAPTPVTAFLAIGSKTAGFAALARLLLTVFAPVEDKLIPLFAWLAALTILYGNLGAIPQTNLKRLFGYSSIGHAGYLLIGLAAFHHGGKEAVLVYLLSYLFSTGGAFLVLIALGSALKTDEIGELAGLSKKSPLLAAAMLSSLLSLAGVPPLGGFFGKFYLLLAGVRAGLFWLALVGALNVITSLYYYLKIVKVMYIDKPAGPAESYSLTVDQTLLQAACLAAILAIGIFPGPFVTFAEWAFKITAG